MGSGAWRQEAEIYGEGAGGTEGPTPAAKDALGALTRSKLCQGENIGEIPECLLAAAGLSSWR